MELLRRLSPDCGSAAATGAFSAPEKDELKYLAGYFTPQWWKHTQWRTRAAESQKSLSS